MKRLLSTLLALTMALALVSCGKSNPTPNTGSNKTETPSETADTKTEGNVHIGIADAYTPLTRPTPPTLPTLPTSRRRPSTSAS